MDFFEVRENDLPYKTVCQQGNDLKDAYSGLNCKGTTLHEWEAKSKNYVRRFSKAKQCMQRRITTMKKYNVATANDIAARKKHIFPILAAYAHGKNCARKIGTRKNVKKFEESTNRLLESVAAVQPNIGQEFPKGIQAAANARPVLQPLLRTPYYTPEQWNAIDRFRENPENPEFQHEYDSILDANVGNVGHVGNVRNTIENTESNHENTVVQKETFTFKPARSRKNRKPAAAKPQDLNISILPKPLSKNEKTKLKVDSFINIVLAWYDYVHKSIILDLMMYEKYKVENFIGILSHYQKENSFVGVRKQIKDVLIPRYNKFINDKMPYINNISNQKAELFHKLKKLMHSEGNNFHGHFYNPTETGLFALLLKFNKYHIEKDYFVNGDFKIQWDTDLITISDNNLLYDATVHNINKNIVDLFSAHKNHKDKIEKLKTLIHMKKYKRSSNGIEKQFFTKLDELEAQRPTIGIEYAQAFIDTFLYYIEKRDAFVNFVKTLEQNKINRILLQFALKDLIKNLRSLNIFKPETYSIMTTGLSVFRIKEDAKIETVVAHILE